MPTIRSLLLSYIANSPSRAKHMVEKTSTKKAEAPAGRPYKYQKDAPMELQDNFYPPLLFYTHILFIYRNGKLIRRGRHTHNVRTSHRFDLTMNRNRFVRLQAYDL